MASHFVEEDVLVEAIPLQQISQQGAITIDPGNGNETSRLRQYSDPEEECVLAKESRGTEGNTTSTRHSFSCVPGANYHRYFITPLLIVSFVSHCMSEWGNVFRLAEVFSELTKTTHLRFFDNNTCQQFSWYFDCPSF